MATNRSTLQTVRRNACTGSTASRLIVRAALLASALALAAGPARAQWTTLPLSSVQSLTPQRSAVLYYGTQEIFTIGTDNKLYVNWGSGTSWSLGWVNQSHDPGARFKLAPSAVIYNGTIHVFALGLNGALFDTVWNVTQGFWSVFQIGGIFTSSPSAIVHSDGLIHVYALGQDRTLFEAKGNGTPIGWMINRTAGTAMAAGATPTAVEFNGAPAVFCVDTSFKLHQVFWTGSMWADNTSLGEGTPGTLYVPTNRPAIAITGRVLHVYAVGYDGIPLFHHWFDGAWHRVVSDIACASSPIAVSNGVYVRVFYVASGGRLWEATRGYAGPAYIYRDDPVAFANPLSTGWTVSVFTGWGSNLIANGQLF